MKEVDAVKRVRIVGEQMRVTPMEVKITVKEDAENREPIQLKIIRAKEEQKEPLSVKIERTES